MTEPKDPRPPSGRRIHTDESGHSVWDDTIKTANFELVSTQRLQQLLAEEDAAPREAIHEIANSDAEGYLAENSATGILKVIDDDDLQALLDAQLEDPPPARPAASAPSRPAAPAAAKPADDDELALVSTQTLRQILDIADERPVGKAAGKTARPSRDEDGGFDPYNTG